MPGPRVLPVAEYVSCPKLMHKKQGWKIGIDVCEVCEHMREMQVAPVKAVVCLFPERRPGWKP